MELFELISQLSPTVSVALIIYLIVKDLLRSKNNGVSKLDTQQQTDIAVIKKQLEIYETNHFPTINRRFDKIEDKIDILLKEKL